MKQRGKKSGGAKGKPAEKPYAAKIQKRPDQAGGSCCRLMLIALLVIVVLFGVVVYFLPSPIDPIAYKFSDEDPPQFTGVYALNDKLEKARRLFQDEIGGAEAFATNGDGFVYSGLIDGRVIKIDLKSETFSLVTRMSEPPYDKCAITKITPACGRPLGIEFDSSGETLFVVDAYLGLFGVNIKTGNKKLLFASEPAGDMSCLFFNNLAVLSNGSVFFSCSSAKFPLHDFILDATEATANGKLFHYHPVSGKTSLVRKNIYSANGMIKSVKEDYLLVSEVTRARLLRYYLKGPKAGQWDMFVDNLPGLIDNITPSRKTPGYWAAVVVAREPAKLDFTASRPWIRLLLAKLRLLHLLEKYSSTHSMVLLINEEGAIVKCYHDQHGKAVRRVSEAFEVGDELLIGSYVEPYVARMKMD